MNAMQEHSRSVWMDVKVASHARPLEIDLTIDVAVIGAGIAGLSIGYELLRRGLSVAVLDRGEIAGGMTARTTAHLAPICDDSLAKLVSKRGPEIARGFQESHSAAVDRIEAIQSREGIDCEFRWLDGILFLDPSSKESVLQDEIEAAAKLAVEVTPAKGLALRGLEEAPYLRYPNQAAFHPLKYLQGLCRAFEAKGGRLHPNTAVDKLEEQGDMVRLTLANGHRVMASHAVVATNSPIHASAGFHRKQVPYRSYAMAFALKHGELEDRLYWDTFDPYHYVRLAAAADGQDLLIVGGEDHKTGEKDHAIAGFAALEAWIRLLVPGLGEETHRWSGQVMETRDYSAFIGLGPDCKRIYVTTGDSGQGITHGVIASVMIPEMIAGDISPYAGVYDPARTPGDASGQEASGQEASGQEAGGQETSENDPAPSGAASSPGSVEDLLPGQGAIIPRGTARIAAYRDESGELFERSAACTHLGCDLKWNSFELCWDCPCHGSHFAPDGSVLNAPAVAPLPEPEN
ncbi:FAD dependent oxidoreductase [Bosea sp. LC85]|uniref:FAD-dependent oxidoreductase n=1 Tax=Bosea sp. LC85 TaxID=1502851 RepID=UPI0004E35B11|nr:FAD-dependent oxidoreductase [Bosea sp. LC85]KFC64688.1 FAD dependent oxidoreductase [Bosea sp. LC85]